MSSDGVIGIPDFNLFRAGFGGRPGPSGTTVTGITFTKDATQTYGFDGVTDASLPRKSVKTGATDKANAVIVPAGNADDVFFRSAAAGTATMTPDQAAGTPQAITVTGVAKGATNIEANVGKADGPTKGKMETRVFDQVAKKVSIRLIHEENDDVQVIPVGNLGAPNADCVTAGANGFRDTAAATPDDQIVGNKITTGADGVCDTAANSANVNSTNIAGVAALKTFMNDTIYNQAVLNWTTVTAVAATAVNFDLNRDGKVDVTSGGCVKAGSESQAIIDAAGDLTGFDKNVFLVDNPDDGSFGCASSIPGNFIFVHVDSHSGAQTTNNTTAHELGHGLGLAHFDTVTAGITNLMHATATNPEHLRLFQWLILNP